MINEIKPLTDPPASGYFLCVEIVASGVQAVGVDNTNEDAVVDAWGVDPSALG